MYRIGDAEHDAPAFPVSPYRSSPSLCMTQQAEDVSRLQARIKPYLLRRMKEDVEKAVPPKEETIIEVGAVRTSLGERLPVTVT